MCSNAAVSTSEPTGIHLSDSTGELVVSWSEGDPSTIPYRTVRLACGCALCVDELTGAPLLEPSSIPADVGVVDCHEVGLYGIQIKWTDQHSTGIYTWERLRQLGASGSAQ